MYHFVALIEIWIAKQFCASNQLTLGINKCKNEDLQEELPHFLHTSCHLV